MHAACIIGQIRTSSWLVCEMHSQPRVLIFFKELNISHGKGGGTTEEEGYLMPSLWPNENHSPGAGISLRRFISTGRKFGSKVLVVELF